MEDKKRELTLSISFLIMIGLMVLLVFFKNKPLEPLTTYPDMAGGTTKRIPPTTTQVNIPLTSSWLDLLEQTPYQYTTPLPDSASTNIDGIYAKLDSTLPQWWACRRCADYRPVGGIWKLQFDRGIMRIFYDVTGWRSIASYTISGNRLYLFNDPYCPQVVGEFTWRTEDSELELSVIDDPCSIGLRGKNLSAQPWHSCNSAIEYKNGHDTQQVPPGCRKNPSPQISGVLPDLSITVVVHPGYSLAFAKQPDVIAAANSDVKFPPEGILITHSDTSISYGLNRVLYGEGDWIQAFTQAPFSKMGVQIYGDHTIGWARVIFDGEEVWLGDTATIWSDKGRHGGYIEISDYNPGRHTIRVESLGFDYHPVTVAYFGFSHQDGVER